MAMLIALAVLSIVSVVTGIQSVHSDPSTGTVITYHHGLSRLWALGYAVACAGACYAIYNKKLIAWWVGWIVLIASSVDFLSIVLPATLRDSPPGKWYSSAGVVVAVCAVTAYWGYWWYKQKKTYFTAQNDEQV